MTAPINLYGTLTSPFVRRVRIVAQELGLPCHLVDTATEAGQAELRAKSPIWKVPVIETAPGQLTYDSHAIIARLIEEHGPGALRLPSAEGRWRESNLQHVIDGALDSAINVFYLRREGLDPAQLPYPTKQNGRVRACLEWVASHLDGDYFTADHRVGLTEISLCTALDWMVFRDAQPVADWPVLIRFREHHASRPSFAATRPH
jgi:glutathione S-transferase